MRIFLTGATGFVGSYTLRRLLTSGAHEVAILARPTSNFRRIADLLPRVSVVGGDLAQPETIALQLKRFEPDAVVHLAWQGVLNSARNVPTQGDNITQSLDLVRIAHASGAKHWVGLGSQAEYGPCANRIDEATPTQPTTQYGIAKLATCRDAELLCESLGMRYAWLRLFSSYGPDDDPSWLIPYVALKLLRGERPATTAGEQRWDYIYVDDVAAAIAATVEATDARGVFNLGSGTTATIRSIIERVRDEVDSTAEIAFGEVPYRPDQVMHLEANITKLQTATGWTPQMSLDDGLRNTVNWCRALSQAAERVAA